MQRFASNLAQVLAVLTAAAGAGAVAMAMWYAPIDSEVGVIQKLLYLHLPAAIAAFAGALGVFVAGIAYLWSRDDRWDNSARSAAILVVTCSAIVLLTGMAWGQAFWGFWWTWSPRLTFTLVLFVLYLGYLIMRGMIRDDERRTIASAIYGSVAFLDVPLLYLSAQLLPDLHPTSIDLTGPTRLTMLVCMAPTALLVLWLIVRPWRGLAGRDDPSTSPRSEPSQPRPA